MVLSTSSPNISVGVRQTDTRRLPFQPRFNFNVDGIRAKDKLHFPSARQYYRVLPWN